MPPDPQDRLTLVAQTLLDTVVTILETTSSGAPESRFLTSSQPAIDCEFVAVQVARLNEEVTSPLTPVMATGNRNRFGNVILANYIMYVVRCAPEMDNSGNPPSDEDKTNSAYEVQRDGWVIWNGIRYYQDDIFDDCIGVHFDGGLPIPESGGYVGWAFSIRAAIEGYVPT